MTVTNFMLPLKSCFFMFCEINLDTIVVAAMITVLLVLFWQRLIYLNSKEVTFMLTALLMGLVVHVTYLIRYF